MNVDCSHFITEYLTFKFPQTKGSLWSTVFTCVLMDILITRPSEGDWLINIHVHVNLVKQSSSSLRQRLPFRVLYLHVYGHFDHQAPSEGEWLINTMYMYT